MQHEKFSVTRLFVVVCASVFFLSGCQGGGGDSGAAATESVTLAGSVGDGPIVGATVVVTNASGATIATQTSDEFARYQLTFDVPSSEFPLLVTVEDGTDLVTGTVPDFPLMAAIAAPGDMQVANLNPMGTLAVKLAQRMTNGLSAENLAAANQIVSSTLNFGLDRTQVGDVMFTDVTDENIANIVRTSEAFGEAIRRTRDALISIGYVSDAEQIMDALSADLIDGVLDGRGDADVDSRITVVNNVVSAQVVLETMSNQLKVGGVLAANALDLSIQQVTAARPAVALTASLGVSSELVTQARVLLDAVMRIDSSPALTALNQAIDTVAPGQSSSDLPAVMQSSASDVLEATVQQVSVASEADITAVNDAIREGFDAGGGSANQAPTINGSPATAISVGSLYDFTPTAGDVDGDSLVFVILGKPSWASFNQTTGRLSGTPASADTGSYVGVRIIVSDGVQSARLPTFDIAVSGGSNGVPTISGLAFSAVTVGSQYSFTPTASDPDNDLLSFSIVGKPVWANFDQLSGRLWGTPNSGELGDYSNIRISVSDGTASATLSAFSITVNGLPNRAPSISGSAAPAVNVGSSYSFTPIASDPDGDALTFSIVAKPSWASFNSSTGRLSGTSANAGSWTGIRISVSDGSASATLPAFAITANAVANGAPSISGTPATAVNVGSSYSFAPTASDPDGNTLTFSIVGKPSWASFNSSTGGLSGTPGSAGSWSGISISVSDGSASASLSAFTITVSALPNGSPSIGGSPASSVMVGSGYSFTPTASDPDNDTLTFSISGKPSWASFNSSTGQLSGTPSAGNVGTYASIGISVSDGIHVVNLGSFGIEVIGQALGSASLSWAAPTLNEDGSTLSDLSGFKIYYGTATNAMTSVQTISNSTVTTALVENLNAGTWYFKVTAFDTSGNESVDSGVGSKQIL